MHKDVHDHHTLMSLQYAFSCHLIIQSAIGKRKVCCVTLKKPGGKILDSVEIVSVSSDWEIGDIEEVDASSRSNPIPSETVKSSLPSSTFKLDLNAREEEARSQVVLPYLR